MLDPRALGFPLLVALFSVFAAVYVSWWAVLLPLGYLLGYVDPWSANAKRHKFR